MKTWNGTLFVIDDDPNSRKAVAALASSMKIRCETFASAETFLDRCDPSLTGCALVDFCLGGMDGLQLQERLQAMGSALSVVLISAYADLSLAVRALKGGAVAFIEKPYKDDELADAIRKALERSTHARHSRAEQAEEQQRLAAQELPARYRRRQG
jgi:two-component system, LuxR family, response regulator FixJ